MEAEPLKGLVLELPLILAHIHIQYVCDCFLMCAFIRVTAHLTWVKSTIKLFLVTAAASMENQKGKRLKFNCNKYAQ